jgi:mono/diheme cytochrome c family protein
MSVRLVPASWRAKWKGVVVLGAALALAAGAVRVAAAGPFKDWWNRHKGAGACGECAGDGEWGGQWYWLGSPEQQKRVTMFQYNRYCLRCHGADGRGVWDIPDVPDFTNARWQASRSDGQLARIILEGRGAVMPAFRGTLTLEESWSMARYLRSFAPGPEASRPDLSDKANAPRPAAPAEKP